MQARAATIAAFLLACGKPNAGSSIDSSIGPSADAPIVVDDAPSKPFVSSPAVDIGIDLGHQNELVSIEASAARALTVDVAHHWVLWNLDDSTQVAAGDAASAPSLQPAASLRAGTVAILTATALDVRDASTGMITATIPLPATDWRWGHAVDGSYVWLATTASLQAWSSAGVSLVDIAGDYRSAKISAAPDALRIEAGPAGSQKIEVINIVTQARSTLAYTGTFATWFVDGEGFLTCEVNQQAGGCKVRVYSRNGQQLAVRSLSSPSEVPGGGMGDYVWTYDAAYLLKIYARTDLASPVQTNTLDPYLRDASVRTHPGSLTILHTANYVPESFEIVTLGPQVTTTAPIPIPLSRATALGVYANRWFVGNSVGVIVDSANATGVLSYGRVTNMAGTDSGTAALGTYGRTMILDIGPVSTVTRELPGMANVALTSDATMLIAGGYANNDEVHDKMPLDVISVATGETLHSWDYRYSMAPYFGGYTFAADGSVLCQSTSDAAGKHRVFSDLAGNFSPDYGPPITSGQPPSMPTFSPDGSKATIGNIYDNNIYTNGTLSGVVHYVANLGWLGNDTFLGAKWNLTSPLASQAYVEAVIVYDAAGAEVGQTSLAQQSAFSARRRSTYIGNGQIYHHGTNAIFNLWSGVKLWQGDSRAANGVVVGDYVLFTHGSRVFTERFH